MPNPFVFALQAGLRAAGAGLAGSAGPGGMIAAGTAATVAGNHATMDGMAGLGEKFKETVKGATEQATKPIEQFVTIFAVNAALVILILLGLWLIVRKAK